MRSRQKGQVKLGGLIVMYAAGLLLLRALDGAGAGAWVGVVPGATGEGAGGTGAG